MGSSVAMCGGEPLPPLPEDYPYPWRTQEAPFACIVDDDYFILRIGRVRGSWWYQYGGTGDMGLGSTIAASRFEAEAKTRSVGAKPFKFENLPKIVERAIILHRLGVRNGI